MKYQKEVTLHDNINDLDICLTKHGELYLIKDGAKKRIHAIKVINKREEN